MNGGKRAGSMVGRKKARPGQRSAGRARVSKDPGRDLPVEGRGAPEGTDGERVAEGRTREAQDFSGLGIQFEVRRLGWHFYCYADGELVPGSGSSTADNAIGRGREIVGRML